MANLPALAGLAAAAFLIELLAARFALRIESSGEVSLEHGQLLQLETWATFARNLGAVSGLVALGLSIADWIRPRPFLAIGVRIAVAAMAGVVLPTLVLSTLLPVERTTLVVVLVATGSAHVLAVLFGVGALPWRAAPAARLAVMGIVGASFFAFAGLVVLVVGSETLWQHAHPLGMALRRTGEVSFLLCVPLLALSGLPLQRGWRRLGLAVGALAGALAVLLASRGAESLEPEAWRNVVYGATHFEILLSRVSVAYLVWLGFAVFAGVAALFAPHGRDRQKGVATLLLSAAGYSPTTAGTLIPMILGVSLACRALIAHAAHPSLEAPRSATTDPAE